MGGPSGATVGGPNDKQAFGSSSATCLASPGAPLGDTRSWGGPPRGPQSGSWGRVRAAQESPVPEETPASLCPPTEMPQGNPLRPLSPFSNKSGTPASRESEEAPSTIRGPSKGPLIGASVQEPQREQSSCFGLPEAPPDALMTPSEASEETASLPFSDTQQQQQQEQGSQQQPEEQARLQQQQLLPSLPISRKGTVPSRPPASIIKAPDMQLQQDQERSQLDTQQLHQQLRQHGLGAPANPRGARSLRCLAPFPVEDAGAAASAAAAASREPTTSSRSSSSEKRQSPDREDSMGWLSPLTY